MDPLISRNPDFFKTIDRSGVRPRQLLQATALLNSFVKGRNVREQRWSSRGTRSKRGWKSNANPS